MAGKPTIKEIALLAGVSKTTVSRVLNHKPDVDPATRERILHIIEEQGFVASIPASGLASGRRSLIGMLVPSWIWPLIPELMRGVAEVIEQTPYELVLYSINNADLKKDRSEVINRVLATQLTAGLLAVYPGEASQDLTRLYKQGFPVVIIDDQRGQNDDAIRGIRIHKGNQNRYKQPRETYRLGKPSDLVQGRQRRLGINAKDGQQQSPCWKDDCKMPKVGLNGHHRVALQFKQGTKAVGQKETRRRQSQISQPQVDGKNPFSLINHAGPENERALHI